MGGLFRSLFKPKSPVPASGPEADPLYAQAISAFESKDLAAAIAHLDGFLALRPDHAEAYYKRANALKDLGQFEAALRSYDSAVDRNPDHAYAWCNRGVVQQALGLFEAALASYDRALVLDPGDAVAHSNRGLLLQRASRWEMARDSFDRALAINPGMVQIWFHRGNVLLQTRQFEAALASYDRAVVLKPDHSEAHYNRGVLLEKLHQHSAALESYDRAIAIQPLFYQAHFNRAGLLKERGDREGALAAYERVIAAKSDYAEGHVNRGVVLQELGRHDEALAACDRAIAIRPEYAEAFFNRGNVLKIEERFDAALDSYDRAIAIKPAYAEAHCDRAGVLLELGRVGEAVASYERATTIQPEFSEANYNRSLALLLQGDYSEGWPLYEWRWKNAARLLGEARAIAAPLWLGNESIAGKTILLYNEQGFGDTLQFCRFAKSVADLGATVILEVQAPLVSLLSSLDGPFRVVSEGSSPSGFDYHCPLLSLPAALKITIDTIPAPPRYVHSDPGKVALWRTRLGDRHRPRIGLAWSGNPLQGHDRNRSARLADWIGYLPRDFEYCCLQKEIRAADREVLAQNPWISTFEAEWSDFSDTAALCECVDLVLSVCTSAAHLSAALGRPTWVVLAFNADWRWLVGREDSPWYPTARLYRQPVRGAWGEVLARVAHDLRERFHESR